MEQKAEKQIKKPIALLSLLCLVCMFGCMRITAEDLYSLPQASEQYLKLQSRIDSIINSGAEFSSPTGGPNKQSVQFYDLNGSGVDEVIAFFSFPGDSALRIYMFEQIDGDFAVAGIIEGVGTAIESVRYVDMDGDGLVEIIVGWQMSAALKFMSIYSIKDFHSVLLAEREYAGITVYDLNGDGSEDVVALRLPAQDTGAVAEIFTLMQDGEMISAEARLSNGIETISRVLTGKLVSGIPAISVESEGKFDNGSFVTDIFICRDGSLVNISCKGAAGISEDTVRARIPRIQSSDINKDGIIKVPIPRLLRAQSDTDYYAIDWYTFDDQGESILALTTYHNDFDEWYLILPFDWRGKVSVRREDAVSGERTVIFSFISTGEEPGKQEESYEDFLKIYKLYGDKGEARAGLPGRTILTSEGTAVYAFELLAEPNSFMLTFDEQLIKENFRLIYSDWLAGMM